jgi:hypothetical protein
MKNFVLIFICAVASACYLSACVSGDGGGVDYEKLTVAEKKLLTENARQILLRSGKKSRKTLSQRFSKEQKHATENSTRKLSFREKSIIKSTDPVIRLHYKGDKYGRASMSWETAPGKKYIIIARGYLTGPEKTWTMRVVDCEDIVITPDVRKRLERSGSPLLKKLGH